MKLPIGKKSSINVRTIQDISMQSACLLRI